jgi:hypothetical protein
MQISFVIGSMTCTARDAVRMPGDIPSPSTPYSVHYSRDLMAARERDLKPSCGLFGDSWLCLSLIVLGDLQRTAAADDLSTLCHAYTYSVVAFQFDYGVLRWVSNARLALPGFRLIAFFR